jgi:hypothetical protein
MSIIYKAMTNNTSRHLLQIQQYLSIPKDLVNSQSQKGTCKDAVGQREIFKFFAPPPDPFRTFNPSEEQLVAVSGLLTMAKGGCTYSVGITSYSFMLWIKEEFGSL